MKDFPGSLMVKTLNAAGTGSIPDLGTKIPHAAQHCQNQTPEELELNSNFAMHTSALSCVPKFTHL